MPRNMPPKCLRGLRCNPLHAVASDDAMTFVCCGLHGEEKHDLYRLCFRSETTDSMYDHDALDLFDLAEVAIRAMSTDQRLRASCADKVKR